MASCSNTDVLFGLLRIALESDSVCESEPLAQKLNSFSGEDWDGLLLQARRQAVFALVCDAVSSLADAFEVEIPQQKAMAMMIEQDRIERNNLAVKQTADALLEDLRTQGFSPVLMKGPSAAALYPKSQLRTPGDIDIYIPPHEWQHLAGFLGDEARRLPDGSLHCRRRGIDIDWHEHYFDLVPKGMTTPDVASDEATLLMLSQHILKHAMGPGVGLRQICDMAVAYRQLHWNREELLSIYSDCGTLRWNIMLSDFIRTHLGVDSGLSLKTPVRSDSLEKIVFSGGNFGHWSDSRTKALSSGKARRKADTLLRFIGRMPFGLRYAPKLYFRYITSLAKGNMS